MNARRAVARVTAVAASTVVVASGLTATAWAGAATVASGSPTVNNGSHQVVFDVPSLYLSSPATVNVTLQRHGTGSTAQDRLTATGSYSAGKVTATVNFAAANPGAYDATLSQGPTSDSCSSCVSVLGVTPTATSVSPSTLGQGTTDGGYQNFTITGSNFTKGLYTQCTVDPPGACPGNGPWVRVVRGGASDDNVTLTQTDGAPTATTPTTITLRVAVTGTDTSAYTDSIQVISSDTPAKIATCTDCLTITPQPSVDSIALIPTDFPDATPLSNQIGQNATGQTLVLSGDAFTGDSTVSFVKPDGAGDSETITAGTPVVDTATDTITVPNVNTTNVATPGDWGVVVASPSRHSSSDPATLTVNPKPVATDVDYVDSSTGEYGQGAKGVKLDVFVDPEASPFFAGSGLTPSSTPHTLVRLGLGGVVMHAQDATLGAGGADNEVRATFSIPEPATTDDYEITVVNPDGGTSDPCDNSVLLVPNTCVLSVVTGPKIGSMSPSTLAPGSTSVPVTISGSGFHTGTDNLHVRIGTVDAPLFDEDATAADSSTVTVTVSVPEGTDPDDFNVVVTNNDDKGAGTYPDLFHVTNFIVSGASPSSSLNDGAVAVTISGTNLDPGATVSLVMTGVDPIVGTTNNASGTDSDTALHRTFQLLNKGPGSYDIQVTATGDGGTGTCSECFEVVAEGGPTLTGVSPDTVGGGASDVTLTLTGTRIFPGATVVFGSAKVHPVGDAQVTAPNSLTQHVSVDSDAAPGTTTVRIRNSDGQQSGTQNLTITPAPTVSDIDTEYDADPADPPRAASGQTFDLTVKGTNFQDGAELDFSEGSITASDVVVNEAGTQLTAAVTVPGSVTAGGASVAVQVKVVNPDAGEATSPTDLAIDPAPSIDTLDPARAPRGRTFTVHVFGDHFASDAALTSVDGTLGVSDVDVISEHQIDASLDTTGTPRGAHSLKVDNHDGGTDTRALVVFTRPGAPRNLVARTRDTALAVSWSPPASNGGDALLSYTAVLTKHRTGSTVARYTSRTASTLSHRFGKLVNGVRYDVRVVATNHAGSGKAATASGRPKFATTLSIKRSARSIEVGSKVTLSGRLLRKNGKALAGVRVSVFRTAFTVTKKYDTVKTNARGKWRLTFTPKRTAKYYASYRGSRVNQGARSTTVRIRVHR